MMFKTLVFCCKSTYRRTITTRPHVPYNEQTNSFIAVFPEVVNTITKSELFSQVPQRKKHFVDVVEYSVMKEKRFRPPLFLESYKLLEKPEKITEQSLHLANILAWCIDLIQAYMNMKDDTMDESEFRCDDVCWHKKENIGLSSFKDSMFLFESAFILLEKYFKDKSVYVPLINLFQEMNRRFILGQSLDWHWRLDRKVDFSIFSRNLFTTIGRNKGGFTIVEAPFQAACILSDNYSKFLENKDLIKEISHGFQIDNDVLELFHDGKIRTDIGENIRQGQCTWMAIEVLENGREDLKRIFKDNYGRPGTEFENKVINVYLEMDLFSKYMEYKNNTLKFINKSISQMEDLSLRRATVNLYQKIFLSS